MFISILLDFFLIGGNVWLPAVAGGAFSLSVGLNCQL